MKTSTIPALRVSPELRDQAEAVLAEGETLSSFVLDSINRNIAQRKLEQEFIARGLAGGERAKRSGKYLTAASVVAKLERRLKSAKKRSVTR